MSEFILITDNIHVFVEYICTEMWKNLINTTNVNVAYDIFLGAFMKKNMTNTARSKNKHKTCKL